MRNSFAFLFLLYLLIISTHKYWLPFFGEFLIVKSSLVEADLIVVSTGSYSRVHYAIELMKKGYSPKMLLLGDTRYKVVLANKNILEVAEQEVLEEGVPREKLIVRHSTSTRDDARLAMQTMMTLGLKSAIVISDNYNMRRLAMVFDRTFQGSTLQLGYLPAELSVSKYTDHWWESYLSFSYVLKEWIKYPINYYLLVSGKEAIG